MTEGPSIPPAWPLSGQGGAGHATSEAAGATSPEAVLRAKAREAIRSGRLPDRRAERVWGGRGLGGPCSLCGAPVKPDEVELEIELAPNGAAGQQRHALHHPCFSAWELGVQQVSRGLVLPEADGAGSMLGRARPNERDSS